jgi:hypothetical protein
MYVAKRGIKKRDGFAIKRQTICMQKNIKKKKKCLLRKIKTKENKRNKKRSKK